MLHFRRGSELACSAHPKAILFAVLALHFAAFSLVAVLTQPTLPLDVIEQVSWARNPEWAYFKHRRCPLGASPR